MIWHQMLCFCLKSFFRGAFFFVSMQAKYCKQTGSTRKHNSCMDRMLQLSDQGFIWAGGADVTGRWRKMSLFFTFLQEYDCKKCVLFDNPPNGATLYACEFRKIAIWHVFGRESSPVSNYRWPGGLIRRRRKLGGYIRIRHYMPK